MNLPEQTASTTITTATKTLQLPTIRRIADELADQALRDTTSHRAYLAELLLAEIDERAERRRIRRINEARFPRRKNFDDYDLDATTIDPTLIGALADPDWIDHGRPVVLLGDSGTGKTHLLIAAGTTACERGQRVRYVTAAALVNELTEAADHKALSRAVARYGRLDLLLIDELGYLHLDERGAELLFQVITEREERASIAVATNAPFSEWNRTFTDPRLCAAVIDRLTFNALIIETGTASYRLRTSTTR